MEDILKVVTEEFLPSYGSEEAAGLDLYCSNEEVIVLKPGETVKVPTGIKVQIPEGYFGAIYPRSSTGVKKGLALANTVGIIDSDYRGEIRLVMVNNSKVEVEIHRGDRLCQMIIQPYLRVKVQRVDELDESVRGEGGFGSTGR